MWKIHVLCIPLFFKRKTCTVAHIFTNDKKKDLSLIYVFSACTQHRKMHLHPKQQKWKGISAAYYMLCRHSPFLESTESTLELLIGKRDLAPLLTYSIAIFLSCLVENWGAKNKQLRYCIHAITQVLQRCIAFIKINFYYSLWKKLHAVNQYTRRFQQGRHVSNYMGVTNRLLASIVHY